MTQQKSDAEQLSKGFSMNRLLGIDCLCVQRNKSARDKGFTAIRAQERIDIFNNKTEEKWASISTKGLYLDNTQVVVEINKLSDRMYIVALVGKYKSLTNPERTHTWIEALDSQFEVVLRYHGSCFTHILKGPKVFSYEYTPIDKLYLVLDGHATDILQYNTAPRDSTILVDEIIEPEAKFRRRLLYRADGLEVRESNEWWIRPSFKMPRMLVVIQGVLVTPTIEVIHLEKMDGQRYTEREALLIGDKGRVKRQGEVKLQFRDINNDIPYSEIWMDILNLEVIWSKHARNTINI
jgi:hypothetical protein